jgi:hypothetical protein
LRVLSYSSPIAPAIIWLVVVCNRRCVLVGGEDFDDDNDCVGAGGHGGGIDHASPASTETTLAPTAPSPAIAGRSRGEGAATAGGRARARGGVVERGSEDGPPPHPPPPPGDCAVGTPPSGTTLAPAAPSPSPDDPGGKAPRRREDARGREGASSSGVRKTDLLPTLVLRQGGTAPSAHRRRGRRSRPPRHRHRHRHRRTILGGRRRDSGRTRGGVVERGSEDGPPPPPPPPPGEDCAIGTPPSGTTLNDTAILGGLARMQKIRGARLTYRCRRSWGRARGRLLLYGSRIFTDG